MSCPCDGGSNCCDWASAADAEVHLRHVALELTRLDADVVNLAEAEDCVVLRKLLELLPEGHGYVPYLAFGADTYLGQNVGLLTRVDPELALSRSAESAAYPVANTACPSTDAGSSGCTKHYVTRLPALAGLPGPILLAGVHLLSNPSDGTRCLKREAQATVVVDELARVAGGVNALPTVILGDMNTFDADAIDFGGQAPIDRTLAIFKEAARGGENAMERVPLAERFSEWWDRDDDCVYEPDASPSEVSLLDHIVLSPELAALIVDARVHHDWTPACVADAGYYSDHFPISVTLRLDVSCTYCLADSCTYCTEPTPAPIASSTPVPIADADPADAGATGALLFFAGASGGVAATIAIGWAARRRARARGGWCAESREKFQPMGLDAADDEAEASADLGIRSASSLQSSL